MLNLITTEILNSEYKNIDLSVGTRPRLFCDIPLPMI